MKTQVIQDSKGIPSGVFVPMDDWEKIKAQYPDIEIADENMPQWEKELVDERLEAIAKNPERLQPFEKFLAELRRKI